MATKTFDSKEAVRVWACDGVWVCVCVCVRARACGRAGGRAGGHHPRARACLSVCVCVCVCVTNRSSTYDWRRKSRTIQKGAGVEDPKP